METERLDPKLRLPAHTDMGGKVLVVRLAHKVVSSGLNPVEDLLDRK